MKTAEVIYEWGCGHTGPAACRQCFEKRCEQLSDYENAAKHAADEACDLDEKHCSCVGLLRAKLKRSRIDVLREALLGVREAGQQVEDVPGLHRAKVAIKSLIAEIEGGKGAEDDG